jgi:hypothetical protein
VDRLGPNRPNRLQSFVDCPITNPAGARKILQRDAELARSSTADFGKVAQYGDRGIGPTSIDPRSVARPGRCPDSGAPGSRAYCG